jgi:hypothetical protein
MNNPDVSPRSLNLRIVLQQFITNATTKFCVIVGGLNALKEGHHEIMEFLRYNLMSQKETTDLIFSLKTELKSEISKSKNEIMDYVDKKHNN